MLRSEFLKQKIDRYLDNSMESTSISKKAKAETFLYLQETIRELEAGRTTPAFKDGNVEVCSSCGGNLLKGCSPECRTLESGFTYIERIIKKTAGSAV